MICEQIQKDLFDLQDEKYRDFTKNLTPGLEADSFIGVRTPELKKLAKKYAKAEGIEEFLGALPHKYFEENQLHAFLISEMKDYEVCIREMNRFLPFVNNWATCDQMSPKIFAKHKKELLGEVKVWIKSKETYTVRYAIGTLMRHYLEDDYDEKYPKMVAAVRSDEYYINMMIAWYFATALAKQYESILPYIEERKLSKWTHNKTIQKAVESYRITPEQKEYLRSLKV